MLSVLNVFKINKNRVEVTRITFTCFKSAIETVEKGVKYVQN